jgi:hypothetical protein
MKKNPEIEQAALDNDLDFAMTDDLSPEELAAIHGGSPGPITGSNLGDWAVGTALAAIPVFGNALSAYWGFTSSLLGDMTAAPPDGTSTQGGTGGQPGWSPSDSGAGATSAGS